MVTTRRITKISKGNEAVPAQDKEAGSSEQSKQKMDGIDIYLGPPWTKDDIKSFYVLYQKYQNDWIEISSMLGNRTPQMVQYFFKMNMVYLSRPERATSAAGLIRRVMHHYKLLEDLGGVESAKNVFNKRGSNLGFRALLQESQESKVKRKREKEQDIRWRTSKMQTLETGICNNEGARKYEEEEESIEIRAEDGMRWKEVQQKVKPPSPTDRQIIRQLLSREGKINLDTLASMAWMILNNLPYTPGCDSGLQPLHYQTTS